MAGCFLLQKLAAGGMSRSTSLLGASGCAPLIGLASAMAGRFFLRKLTLPTSRSTKPIPSSMLISHNRGFHGYRNEANVFVHKSKLSWAPLHPKQKAYKEAYEAQWDVERAALEDRLAATRAEIAASNADFHKYMRNFTFIWGLIGGSWVLKKFSSSRDGTSSQEGLRDGHHRRS